MHSAGEEQRACKSAEERKVPPGSTQPAEWTDGPQTKSDSPFGLLAPFFQPSWPKTNCPLVCVCAFMYCSSNCHTRSLGQSQSLDCQFCQIGCSPSPQPHTQLAAVCLDAIASRFVFAGNREKTAASRAFGSPAVVALIDFPGRRLPPAAMSPGTPQPASRRPSPILCGANSSTASPLLPLHSRRPVKELPVPGRPAISAKLSARWQSLQMLCGGPLRTWPKSSLRRWAKPTDGTPSQSQFANPAERTPNRFISGCRLGPGGHPLLLLLTKGRGHFGTECSVQQQ